jgi:6-phosphogluconolactonase (cycloisomerase 2 family)
MPNDPPFVATRAGAGPRHIAFHPQMPLAYVINELGSSVTAYRFDAQRGSLQPIQMLPSTPASHTGNNTGAEIAVTPSGRVVYASNRGHDSIAIFAVDPHDGTLTPVGWAPTHAKSPRFFASIRRPKPSMRPTPTRATAISRTRTRSCPSGSTKRTAR